MDRDDINELVKRHVEAAYPPDRPLTAPEPPPPSPDVQARESLDFVERGLEQARAQEDAADMLLVAAERALPWLQVLALSAARSAADALRSAVESYRQVKAAGQERV